MLKIRLARGGRKKSPFYRIVLTEHTKPIQSGYKEVLGWFDPIKHEVKCDVEAVKSWIGKGAQPSNRVAKILFKETSDDFFKGYIVESIRIRKKKNAPDEPEETPEAVAPVEEKKEEVAEAPAEEVAAPEAEAPKEEVQAEEAQEETQEQNEEEAAE